MKRWQAGVLSAAISLVAVYFVARQVDLPALSDALAQARYGYLLPTAGLMLLALVTRAIRWRVLLSGGLSLGRAFSIMNVAYLVNGVLPLRIGEIARIYLATRATPPVQPLKTASTIIVERLLDLLAVILLLTLALAAGFVPAELRAAALIAGPAAFGGFLSLVLLSGQRERVLKWLDAIVTRFSRLRHGGDTAPTAQRLYVWFGQFLDGLQPLGEARALFLALVWTVLAWGVSVAAGYVLMFTFYEGADWVSTCLYIAAAALAIAVPAVPGNIGTYEASILVALSATGYGEPYDTAVAFALVVHGINLAVYAVMGIAGFIQEGISLEQLSQGVQGMRGQSKVILP